MSSFLYFLAAAVLLVGLLLVGGYIGTGHKVGNGYSPTAHMARLVTGNRNATSDNEAGSGGCTSCKWY